MIPPSELSAAVKTAIDQEAERIAKLGDEWQPTSENLCEVVEAAFGAERAEWHKKQEQGIKNAIKSGSNYGRPRTKIPPNFQEIHARVLKKRTDCKGCR